MKVVKRNEICKLQNVKLMFGCVKNLKREHEKVTESENGQGS